MVNVRDCPSMFCGSGRLLQLGSITVRTARPVVVVVKAASNPGSRPMPTPEPANDDRTPPPPPAASAIVTIRRRKHAMLAHLLEDLTPEEHRRRGDTADALFRAVVRRATGKDRP
jgi:hypothetical protein